MSIPDSYPPPLKLQPPPFTAPTVPSVIAAKWTGVLPDKYIAILVEQVSQQNLQGWVNDLSAFHNRHTLGMFIDPAANWIVGRFQQFGYTDVIKFPFTRQGHQLHNVVCTKAGTGATGQIIVICGHYDCIMQNHGDSAARAPGADDNASGIAAILEIARILAEVDLEDTVQFIAFAGEEQGLWGSSAYAQHVQANNINISRLINLDMIGFPPPAGTVTVEQDQGNAVSGNDQASQDFANLMAQMAADYTALTTQRGPIYGSDYMPFEEAGIVVIGAYDGEGNPNYHSDTDTPTTLNYSYLVDVTRMTLATLLNETLSVIDETMPPVDLYIRDSAADTGDQPSPIPHWHSPDIWVRNNPPPGDDPNLGHQPPINNQPNFLYVRVHNRGSQAAAANAFSVKVFRCNPGTGMVWPDHFHALGTLTITEQIPTGGAVRVGPFNWTPQIVDHECLLAIVSGAGDHAVPDVYNGRLNHGLLVRYDNNVGQRNVASLPSVPGGKTKTVFVLRGALQPTMNKLTLDAGAMPADTKIMVRTLRRIIDGSGLTNIAIDTQGAIWSTLTMQGGVLAEIYNFALHTNDQVTIELSIDFSLQAEHLERYPLIATQEQNGVVAGRMTIEITSVKEVEDWVFGNPRSRELHVITCPFWPRISQKNKVPFETVDAGITRGYDGCAFCLPEFNTG